MPTVAEVRDYYTNLLIIQYAQKPKIRATIDAIVEQIISTNVLFDIRDGFNVDTAVGEQLDIIGKYVGISRYYNGISFTGKNFAFVTYTNTTPVAIQTGFNDYAESNPTGKVIQYTDVVSGTLVLGDDDYRVILKLKILQNNSDHSHKDIDDGLYIFFSNNVRADSVGNMTMDYFIPSQLSAIMNVAISKDVLPRPMGVGIRYLISEDEGFFGFATYSSTPAFNKGFATYADVDTKTGNTLTYNKLEG